MPKSQLQLNQLPNISTSTILGRSTAGTGNIEEIPSSSVATLIGALQVSNIEGGLPSSIYGGTGVIDGGTPTTIF